MKLMAWDLETHLIQPGLLAPPIVCGSAKWEGEPSLLLTKHEAIDEVVRALRSGAVICGANVAYDFGCLLAERPELFLDVWNAYSELRVFDVLIAATLEAIADGRLRDEDDNKVLVLKSGRKIPNGRYSLEAVTEEWLGRVDAKEHDTFRLSYALLEGLPFEQWPEVAKQYPKDDAENTLLVAKEQIARCRNLGDLDVQAHAAFCMHLGAIWGLRTDPASVAAFEAEVSGHLAEIAEDAKKAKLLKPEYKGRAPNKVISKWTKDTKAIKERVFQAYNGLPPTTDTGDISTSRDTLKESGDDELERFAEYSKWEKLGTYAPALKVAARVPYNVESNPILSTGRASYKGLIQLMPRKGGVRECFVARPGCVWSSVDYAAIEMSTLAQVCLWALGQSKLAEAINADIDPHSLFAANMTGAGYEDFLARKKQPAEKDLRQAAKAANFGFPGMMGAAKFVVAKKREGERVCEWLHRDGKCGEVKVREWKGRDTHMPLCRRCIEEAEKLRAFYLQQWPEMPNYFKWVSAQGDEVQQFVSKRIRGGLTGPSAANTFFQGLAADGAKRALVKMTEEMYLDEYSPLYGSRLIIFAHDETIVEMPEERAHAAAHRQAAIMVEEMRKIVPDVKVKAEPALMRRWYKQAEAKFVDGRLVPWEP